MLRSAFVSLLSFVNVVAAVNLRSDGADAPANLNANDGDEFDPKSAVAEFRYSCVRRYDSSNFEVARSTAGQRYDDQYCMELLLPGFDRGLTVDIGDLFKMIGHHIEANVFGAECAVCFQKKLRDEFKQPHGCECKTTAVCNSCWGSIGLFNLPLGVHKVPCPTCRKRVDDRVNRNAAQQCYSGTGPEDLPDFVWNNMVEEKF
jgi:hypothetical protein